MALLKLLSWDTDRFVLQSLEVEIQYSFVDPCVLKNI